MGRLSFSSGSFIIACHLLWGLFPVGSRYLTTRAAPQPFTVLSVLVVATFITTITLFIVGNSVDGFLGRKLGRKEAATIEATTTVAVTLRETTPKTILESKLKTCGNASVPLATRLGRRNILILFGFVASARAISNIASMAKTKAAYTQIINSLSPIVAAILDRVFFKAEVPSFLIVAVIFSFAGCVLIAIARELEDQRGGESNKPLNMDDLVGVLLQFSSMFFSVWSRFLMLQTENQFSANQLMQFQSVCTFFICGIFSFVLRGTGDDDDEHVFWSDTDTSNWNLTNIAVFLFVSVVIIVIGSLSQVNAIRAFGVSMFSSFSSMRILSAILGGYLALDEGINSGLEWFGVVVVIVTVTAYLHKISEQPKEEMEKFEMINKV